MMTPEEMAAHKARLEIIEKLGYGPSSIAGADWIVKKVQAERRDRDAALLKISEYKKDSEMFQEMAGNATKKLLDANLQVGEVTAHRDRLRDMLNDVRGMAFSVAFTSKEDIAARILRRIEDGIVEKPKSERSAYAPNLDYPSKPIAEKRIDRCPKCGKEVDNVIHFCPA